MPRTSAAGTGQPRLVIPDKDEEQLPENYKERRRSPKRRINKRMDTLIVNYRGYELELRLRYGVKERARRRRVNRAARTARQRNHA